MDRSDQSENKTLANTKDISLKFSKSFDNTRVDVDLELITDTTGTSFLPDVDTLDDNNRIQYLEGKRFFFRHTLRVFEKSIKEVQETVAEQVRRYKVEARKPFVIKRPRRKKVNENQNELFDISEYDIPQDESTGKQMVMTSESRKTKPKYHYQSFLFDVEADDEHIVIYDKPSKDAMFQCVNEEEFDKPLTCRNSCGSIDISNDSSIVEDAKRLLSKPHVLHKVEKSLQELQFDVDLSDVEFELLMTTNDIPQARGSGVARLPYNWEVLNKEMVPLE